MAGAPDSGALHAVSHLEPARRMANCARVASRDSTPDSTTSRSCQPRPPSRTAVRLADHEAARGFRLDRNTDGTEKPGRSLSSPSLVSQNLADARVSALRAVTALGMEVAFRLLPSRSGGGLSP